jgi:hypothetical protein
MPRAVVQLRATQEELQSPRVRSRLAKALRHVADDLHPDHEAEETPLQTAAAREIQARIERYYRALLVSMTEQIAEVVEGQS